VPKWLGLSYDVSELNFKTNDHTSDSYLKLNPLGQSPTYIGDNGVHTESVAIAMYLYRKGIGLPLMI
jgi:glutathione S-transferase